MPTIDEMAAYCRRRGFVFPSSEIHGSLAGFFDYGPLGVEMKRNIKNLYNIDFVTQLEKEHLYNKYRYPRIYI